MEHLDNPTTVERMLLDQAKRTHTPANGSREHRASASVQHELRHVLCPAEPGGDGSEGAAAHGG